ncbi:putative calcium uniporter protein [Dioscorea sansibarensis]
MQVVKAVESSISMNTRMKRREEEDEELREMEEKKREIDEEAGRKARRELWCGLGFMVAQTAGFMRLTFWELSWDVMEPICFFFTSLSFMAGYAFFLRTSKDPSFEGLFSARFAAKQRRLMRARGFDLHRFNELRVSAPATELCECRKMRGFVGAGGSSQPN